MNKKSLILILNVLCITTISAQFDYGVVTSLHQMDKLSTLSNEQKQEAGVIVEQHKQDLECKRNSYRADNSVPRCVAVAARNVIDGVARFSFGGSVFFAGINTYFINTIMKSSAWKRAELQVAVGGYMSDFLSIIGNTSAGKGFDSTQSCRQKFNTIMKQREAVLNLFAETNPEDAQYLKTFLPLTALSYCIVPVAGYIAYVMYAWRQQDLVTIKKIDALIEKDNAMLAALAVTPVNAYLATFAQLCS